MTALRLQFNTDASLEGVTRDRLRELIVGVAVVVFGFGLHFVASFLPLLVSVSGVFGAEIQTRMSRVL